MGPKSPQSRGWILCDPWRGTLNKVMWLSLQNIMALRLQWVMCLSKISSSGSVSVALTCFWKCYSHCKKRSVFIHLVSDIKGRIPAGASDHSSWHSFAGEYHRWSNVHAFFFNVKLYFLSRLGKSKQLTSTKLFLTAVSRLWNNTLKR
jgi:hypothetical protein